MLFQQISLKSNEFIVYSTRGVDQGNAFTRSLANLQELINPTLRHFCIISSKYGLILNCKEYPEIGNNSFLQ